MERFREMMNDILPFVCDQGNWQIDSLIHLWITVYLMQFCDGDQSQFLASERALADYKSHKSFSLW